MFVNLSWKEFMSLKKAANKKKPSKALKRADRGELTLMNLKVTRKDRETLLSLAQKYTEGNLSAWLRHAGLKYRPA